jgi:hypothetical protein
MSDYFAILASRIAGAPDALRPVLPSRFEPVEANFGKAGEDDEGDPRDVVLEVERKAALPMPPLRSQAKDEQFEKNAPSPAQPQAPAVQLPPASSPPQPHVGGLPEPAIPAAEVHEQPSGPTEPVSTRRLSPVIAPAPPQRPPAVERAPSSRIEPAPESSRPSVSRPSLLPLEPDEPPLLQRKAPLRDHSAEDAEPSPERDRQPPVAAPIEQALPRPVPPPSRGDRLPAAVAPAAAGPAIQITIGRIEVEAVLPPPPAAAPYVRRAAGPLLSLDEYLARRSGSGT